MAKLANCRAELLKGDGCVHDQIHPIQLENLEEKNTSRATSNTQLQIETQQPPQDEGMSIQELVGKHMNEGKNLDAIL